MDRRALDEAVGLLARTRLERVPFAGFPPRCAPAREAEGHEIQAALHRRLSGRLGPIAGYKIGCTTKVMQDYLGIDHPCSGGVFGRTVHRSPVSLPYDGWCRVGVECEIAVTLGRDLDPERAPYDRQRVAAAVDGCMAAIEIVDDRYVDYASLDAETLIADDFFGAGCVLGEPVRDWQTLDLAAVVGAMEVNEREAGRGTGAAVLGHPLDALALLANEAAGRGATLVAGTFVLTGSIVQTHWLQPGDRVVCRLDGLGEAALTVEP